MRVRRGPFPYFRLNPEGIAPRGDTTLPNGTIGSPSSNQMEISAAFDRIRITALRNNSLLPFHFIMKDVVRCHSA